MNAAKVVEDLKQRFPNEPEYIQAVSQVLPTIEEEYNKHPEFEKANLIERLCIPDRVCEFRITWVDDKGNVQTNMGYRIQHNNAIGPYKGGLRYHKSVNLGILKFLAFEQTFKNSLTTLPILADLTELTTIMLNSNKLTKITGVFPNAVSLKTVSLGDNQLVELPPEFANAAITSLLLDGNNITTIPDEYANLKLTQVGISQNMLDCSVVQQKFPPKKAPLVSFGESCIQAQQKTDDEYPALPTSFSTEPPREGLDAYEITSIILTVVFVIGTTLAIVFFIRYRNGGIGSA